MRRISLTQLNVVAWAALLLLAGWYHSELWWSARAFYAELRGTGYLSHPQWQMYNRAADLFDRDEDPGRAIELLERSLAIEPNPAPLHLLGRIHATEGRLDQAREHLLKLRDLDPSHLEGLLDLAEVYQRLGRHDERRRVLEEGLAWFEVQELLFTPRPDESVWEGYNEKARDVHDQYALDRRILEARLRLLSAGEEVINEE